MKKVLFLAIAALLIAATAQAQGTVKQFPYAKKVAYSINYDSIVSLSIKNTQTVVTVPVTDSMTVNIAPSSRIYPGDRLDLICVFDTIRTVTFGTKFKTATYTSTKAKTQVLPFIWDGVKFVGVLTD